MAVAVPTALALRGRLVPPSGPGPAPTLPYSTATRAPLRLRPTWVPEGLVAYSRSVSVDGVDSRQEWLTTQDSQQRLVGIIAPRQSPALTISVQRPRAERSLPHHPLPDKANTTVGGRLAVYSEGGGRLVLTWVLAGDLVATAQASGSLDIKRIADSTVDDDHAVCEVAMRAGWLPTIFHEGRELVAQQRIRVWGTAQHWVQEATYGMFVIKLARVPSVADIPRVLDQPGINGDNVS